VGNSDFDLVGKHPPEGLVMNEVASLELKMESSGVSLADTRLRSMTLAGKDAEVGAARLRKEAESSEVRWKTQAAQLDLIATSLTHVGNKAHEAAEHESHLKEVAHELVKEYLGFEAAKEGIEKTIEATVGLEKIQARLTGVTGGVAEAKEAFEVLEEISEKTIFTEDQMANAFLKLANLGLDPSERALKAFSNIASATGVDIESLTETTVSASMGMFRGLKAFGVQAEAVGNSLKMTFRGTTTTIANSSSAIQNYIVQIGEKQFAGAAERQFETMEGGIKGLKEAWEKFYRTIGQSSIGDAIKYSFKVGEEAIAFATSHIRNFERALQVVSINAIATADKLVGLITFDKERLKRAEETKRALLEEIKVERQGEENEKKWKEATKERAEEEDRLSKYKSGKDSKKKPVDTGQEMRAELYTLIAGLRTEEEKLLDSYEERKGIILRFVDWNSSLYGRLNDANEEAYTSNLVKLREAKNSELEEVRKFLKKEEGLLQEAYAERRDVVNTSPADAESKANLIASLKEKETAELVAIRHSKERERETVLSAYRTAEEDLEASHRRRLQDIEDMASKDVEINRRKDELIAKEAKKHTAEIAIYRLNLMQQVADNATTLTGNLADTLENWGGEQSAAYKKMFAAQQAFAIASGTLNMWQDISNASATPYPGNLALIAKAFVDGSGILAKLSSTSYAGAYDEGGKIPGGKFGIVGEYGPEIVSGPANVTGRRDTAELLRNSGPQMMSVRNINLFDTKDIHAVVAAWAGSEAGQRVVVNIVKRNAREIHLVTRQ
jgi:hypothetical protein